MFIYVLSAIFKEFGLDGWNEICLQAFKWWHFAAKISTFQWKFAVFMRQVQFFNGTTHIWFHVIAP